MEHHWMVWSTCGFGKCWGVRRRQSFLDQQVEDGQSRTSNISSRVSFLRVVLIKWFLFRNDDSCIRASQVAAILSSHPSKVIDEGKVHASHLCPTKKCTNPDHPVEESPGDNIRREKCIHRRQSLCKCEPKCLPSTEGKLVKCVINDCDCSDDSNVSFCIEIFFDNLIFLGHWNWRRDRSWTIDTWIARKGQVVEWGTQEECKGSYFQLDYF